VPDTSDLFVSCVGLVLLEGGETPLDVDAVPYVVTLEYVIQVSSGVLYGKLMHDPAEAASRTGGPTLLPPCVWRLYRLWKEWGVSPLELITWPAELVEGFQACDVVERERSPGTGRDLPVVERRLLARGDHNCRFVCSGEPSNARIKPRREAASA